MYKQKGLITGYFERLTLLAIQRLQIKYGIVSSGIPAATAPYSTNWNTTTATNGPQVYPHLDSNPKCPFFESALPNSWRGVRDVGKGNA